MTLTVSDDGEPLVHPRGAIPDRVTYGLVGMTERVALLGGTFDAGPRPVRGWCVHVALPKTPNSAVPETTTR